MVRASFLSAALALLCFAGCEQSRPAAEKSQVAAQEPAAAQAKSEPKAMPAARITWDDLKLPHDDRFDPSDLTDVPKQLEGRRITITGVMHGGIESVKANSEFVLMRYKPNRFGPGGPIDVLMRVTLASGRTVAYFDDSIQVEGILRIDPIVGEDGGIWCVYHVDDARVSLSGEVIDEPAAASKTVEL